MPEPRTSPRKVRTARRRLIAFRLRARGRSLAEIGVVLQISKQAVQRLLEKATAEREEKVEQIRQVISARCDGLIARHYPLATAREKPSVASGVLVLKSCDVVARLAGCYAPQKHKVEHSVIDYSTWSADQIAEECERRR